GLGLRGRARAALGALLARQPDDKRGQELLAWLEELEGDLPAELALRERFAAAHPDDAMAQRELGRARERGADLRRALVAYRRAAALDPGDRIALARLRDMYGRLAPEVMSISSASSEPDSWAARTAVGGTMPFGSRHHLFALAWYGHAHATAPGWWF